jgi:protein SCO1/2
VDRLLLFCFHYDPKAGTYSLAAVRIAQVVGLMTVAVLATVLGVFWHRDVKRQRTAGSPGPGSSAES